MANVLVEAGADGIVTVTVDRPQKLNALNKDVIAELSAAFVTFESDPGLRGLILTGAGEKAFVAGADIVELTERTPAQTADASRHVQGVFRRLETCGKPSVAAINGFALGGGLELAMACTVRVAAETARLGQPEAKLGTLPGYGGSQRLPRLVGRGRALELLLTGDMIDAAKAERIGLVNHVAPAAELMDFARALLLRMLANAPVALKLAMDAVDVGLDSGLEEGMRYEAVAFGLAAATEDFREGTRAFIDKRPAKWSGR